MLSPHVPKNEGIVKTADHSFSAPKAKTMAPPPLQLTAKPEVTPIPGNESAGAWMLKHLQEKGSMEYERYQLMKAELEQQRSYPKDAPQSLQDMAAAHVARLEQDLLASQKAMESMVKDIEALKNRSTSPEAVNDIIARHNKVMTTEGSSFSSSLTSIDKDGWNEEKKKTHTQAVNGAVINDTQTRKDTFGVGNWKGTDTHTREVKVDDKKVSATTSDSTTVDLLAMSFGRSNKSEVKVGEQIRSEETSRSYGVNGISSTTTTVEGTGKDKRTESRTGAVTRADGRVGGKLASSVTEEKDGAKAEVKKEATGGIIAGEEGVGAFAGIKASKDDLGADGVKVSKRVSANGKFTVNVEEVAGSNPKMYCIVLNIGADVGVGVGVGREKMAAKEDDMSANSFVDKASAGVGLSYEGTRGVIIRKVMSAADAKKYLESISAAEAGKVVTHEKELGIIAALADNGGDVASAIKSQTNVATADNLWGLNGMVNGESTTSYGSDKAGVDLNASVEGGGFNFGVKYGHSEKDGWAHTIGKENGQTAMTVALDEESNHSYGLSAGIGVVSGEFGVTDKDSSGQSVKVLVPPTHPQHDEIIKKLHAAKSRQEVEAIVQTYGLKPAKTVDYIGHSEGVTAGIKVAPVSISYGASGSTRESVEADDQGRETRTFEGTNDLGGGIGLGDLKYETSARENLRATLDADGNMTGDLSRTYSETSIDKSLDKFGQNLRHNKLGLLTGSAKNSEKDVHVAGMIMSTADFERIIATAEDPKAWTKLNNSVMLWDDWQRCREEIVAAKGDKVKATRAISGFIGKAGHGRKAVVERAVRDFGSDQGGARYEFPEGLGDLKAQYVTLAVGDPSEAVRTAIGDGDLLGAMNKASKALVALRDLKFRFHTEQDKFSAGMFGEMIYQIGQREHSLTKLIAKVNGLKEGRDMDDEELEDATAKSRFMQLLSDCKDFKRQEMLAFQRVEETFEDGHTSRSELQGTAGETVKLNELYIKWEKAIAEMEQLDGLYGFAASSMEWKQFRPSKKRFKATVGGQNPFEAQSLEAEDNDLRREVEADKFNKELMERNPLTVAARAQSEAKAAAAVRKTERAAICAVLDPQLNALRTEAYSGGGMCNGMNASGRTGEIKAEAKKLWGQAFTQLALGAEAHQQYKYISGHPDAVAKAVEAAAAKPMGYFREAIRLFKAGNQAQRG